MRPWRPVLLPELRSDAFHHDRITLLGMTEKRDNLAAYHFIGDRGQPCFPLWWGKPAQKSKRDSTLAHCCSVMATQITMTVCDLIQIVRSHAST
jgi:hypothetical protein